MTFLILSPHFRDLPKSASVDHSTIFFMLSLEIFVAFSKFLMMDRSPRITASRTQWMSPFRVCWWSNTDVLSGMLQLKWGIHGAAIVGGNQVSSKHSPHFSERLMLIFFSRSWCPWCPLLQVTEGSGEAHLERITGVEAFLFQCEIGRCKAEANREINQGSHEINHLKWQKTLEISWRKSKSPRFLISKPVWGDVPQKLDRTSVGNQWKSAQSEDLMLLCGNLRAMTIGEIAVFKTGKSFHTISELHCTLTPPEGISRYDRFQANITMFPWNSSKSHTIPWTSQLSHIFQTSFYHFFCKKNQKLPKKTPHLVADVVGFRLNPRPQGGDFDARHGRAQGLDAFLDGVGHQLVAGFREGHLHVNWSWSPKSEGNSEGNVWVSSFMVN